jgi:glycosyltransferase involved in cell wall biosynthesis
MYPTEQEPGFGSFVKEQVDDLRAAGVDITVYSFDGRKHTRNYAIALLEVARLARSGAFDLIHAHYGLSGAVSLAQRRVPVVTTFHGSDVGYIRWQGWVSRVVARLTFPIVVSREGATMLGIPEAPIVPIGVDLEFFKPGDRGLARAELGLCATSRYLIFPGSRNVIRKNPGLFDAVVVGLRNLGHSVEGLSLENRTREEVRLLIQASDVMLMTSWFEGSPVAVKEALACAVPVVSVPVGDNNEALRGLPGCALVGREAEALTRAVEAAFDAQDTHELRDRARRYSRRRAAEAVLSIYRNVLVS